MAEAGARLTDADKSVSSRLVEHLQKTPIQGDELLRNLPLFTNRINRADELFMIELYKKSMEVHGCIAEFGVRWGRNLALLMSLRDALEPFNHTRKIYGFDTFEGFPGVDKKDGEDVGVTEGGHSVEKGYEFILADILDCHDKQSAIPHISSYELVVGDVTKSFDTWLQKNPHVIFSLVYFDMDLYVPTKHVLDRIKQRLVKGSVVGFDEVGASRFPGETQALIDSIGLNRIRLRRVPYSAATSYFIYE